MTENKLYDGNGPILKTGLPVPLGGLLNFPKPGSRICSILIWTVHFWGSCQGGLREGLRAVDNELVSVPHASPFDECARLH